MLEYGIVVGAGSGGPAAATLAVQSGRKALLHERHNVPGGYATSFRRGRFEFEATLQAHQRRDLCAGYRRRPPQGR